MYRYIIYFFCLIYSVSILSQDNFLVRFKPKQIDKSNLRLSQKSLERKHKYKIAIDEKDYTIEENRIQKIETILPIKLQSKWLNSIIVHGDETQISKILQIDFVKSVEKISSDKIAKSIQSKLESNYTIEEYGQTYSQIKLHNADLLHASNYEGQGMKIAVFDAGFDRVDSIQSFKHLFDDKRIHSVKNIVENSDQVYRLDGHGTGSLGCIASYYKDKIVGAAPKADYYLFITENPASESRLEEFNWAVAAEMADSIGIDIINSSLGYNEFDDASQNYTKAQMDGSTTIVSQAAKIACEKGIIVVNSAGNAGKTNWHIITAPADVDDVVSVGAVDYLGTVTDFSSRGYNAKNIIKPSVMAVGKNTTLHYHEGKYTTSSGTSFSSPVMAGLIACYWQMHRDKSSEEIRKLIYSSCNSYQSPNKDYGYGIPEFNKIMDLRDIPSKEIVIEVFPNPSQSNAKVEVYSPYIFPSTIEVYSQLKQIMKQDVILKKGMNQLYVDIESYPNGVYFVKVKMDNYYLETRFEKF